MKIEEIKNLFYIFESIAHEYDGVECWSRPIIVFKAKDIATDVTSVNKRRKNHHGMASIEKHIDNNKAIHDMLLSRGIVPMQLPTGKDVKKVERRLA